jgi:hypothetical protein
MSDLTRPTGGDGFSVAGPSPIPSVAKGAPVEANNGATHRLRVGPSRSMRVIAGEVEALLDGVEESSRHSAAILATELVAQVVGRAPDFDGEPVALIGSAGRGCRSPGGDGTGHTISSARRRSRRDPHRPAC